MPARVSALCSEDLNAGEVADAPETEAMVALCAAIASLQSRGIAELLMGPESDEVG